MPGRGAALLKSIKALEAKSKDAEVLDDISKSIVESCKIQEVLLDIFKPELFFSVLCLRPPIFLFFKPILS